MADKALRTHASVVIQKITNLGDQNREMVNRVWELSTAAEVANARTRNLERDHYPRDRIIEDLTIARVEVRKYQERHMALEERVTTVEHRLA